MRSRETILYLPNVATFLLQDVLRVRSPPARSTEIMGTAKAPRPPVPPWI